MRQDDLLLSRIVACMTLFSVKESYRSLDTNPSLPAARLAAVKSGKPICALAFLFLGIPFKTFIGVEAIDLVKMPFSLDLPVGATHGAGTVVLVEGIKMLQTPLWRRRGHRHGGHALRPFRGGAGHGRQRPDRGAGHADAGRHLQTDHRLICREVKVFSPAWIFRAGHFCRTISRAGSADRSGRPAS